MAGGSERANDGFRLVRLAWSGVEQFVEVFVAHEGDAGFEVESIAGERAAAEGVGAEFAGPRGFGLSRKVVAVFVSNDKVDG